MFNTSRRIGCRSIYLLLLTPLLFILAASYAPRASAFEVIFCQPPNSTPIPCLSDATGRIIVFNDPSGLAATLTLYSSTANEGNVIIAAATKTLVTAIVTPTINGFLLLFDASAVPVDGAVTPGACLPVSGNQATAFSQPWKVTNRIVVSFSTTGCFTKTSSASAMFSIWTAP